jgi:hypothetical protein
MTSAISRSVGGTPSASSVKRFRTRSNSLIRVVGGYLAGIFIAFSIICGIGTNQNMTARALKQDVAGTMFEIIKRAEAVKMA